MGGVPEAPRSEQSLRAERVFRAHSTLPRPLAAARVDFARAFDAVMNEHWLRGDEAHSNVAIARACGVDEKTIRAWRSEEKPMPAAALRLLPSQVYSEMLDYIASARGRTPKRALVVLKQAIGDLRGQLAHEDKDEAAKVLRAAQGELAAIERLLAGGDR